MSNEKQQTIERYEDRIVFNTKEGKYMLDLNNNVLSRASNDALAGQPVTTWTLPEDCTHIINMLCATSDRLLHNSKALLSRQANVIATKVCEGGSLKHFGSNIATSACLHIRPSDRRDYFLLDISTKRGDIIEETHTKTTDFYELKEAVYRTLCKYLTTWDFYNAYDNSKEQG